MHSGQFSGKRVHVAGIGGKASWGLLRFPGRAAFASVVVQLDYLDSFRLILSNWVRNARKPSKEVLTGCFGTGRHRTR